MQELEVTFGRASQVWWAFTWRAMLYALLSGAIIGVVVGLICAVLGFDPQRLLPFNLLLGAVVGILASIWVISKILNKKFSSFRIALIQD
jgi:type III secretory pathway component EscS